MINTHVTAFNHAAVEAQEWIDELLRDGPFEHPQQAYSHLRAVLHSLRDRLTVEEAVHLAAQMPMLVRGFYYEGWRPALAPNEEETLEEFFASIRESLDGDPARQDDLRATTTAILALLTERLSEGQIRHVRGQLPAPLQELWPA